MPSSKNVFLMLQCTFCFVFSDNFVFLCKFSLILFFLNFFLYKVEVNQFICPCKHDYRQFFNIQFTCLVYKLNNADTRATSSEVVLIYLLLAVSLSVGTSCSQGVLQKACLEIFPNHQETVLATKYLFKVIKQKH